MSSELVDALSALSKSSSELNRLTDQATEAVRTVEAALCDFSVGISASVPFGDRVEEDQRSVVSGNKVSIAWATRPNWSSERCLEYRRAGKEKTFRVVVKDHNGDLIPWDELSRTLKLEAVVALPTLIRSLHHKVQLRVESARAAISEISQVLGPNRSGEDL